MHETGQAVLRIKSEMTYNLHIRIRFLIRIKSENPAANE